MPLLNEWEHRPLRELTLRTTTWNPEREVRGLIRYVDVSSIDSATLTVASETSLPAADAPSRARKKVRSGDTIFATVRPTLRRIAQIPQRLDDEIVSTAFCVLRADPAKIDPDYLFFATQLDTVMLNIAAMETGASYPAVRESDVLDQVVPVPSLPDQRKIAAALKASRSTLLHESQCEVSAHDLKRAAMRALFTRGLKGEAQLETEIGTAPESWKATPCDDIFKLTSGKTRPIDVGTSPTAEAPYPVLGGNGVMGYASSWNVDSDETLVIGRVGEYCGAVHVASGKVWITDNALYAKQWLLAEASQGFVARFLEYFDLNRFKRMAGQPLVTQGMISEHSIPLPSPAEQAEIVAILDAIDRKIDLHRRKRAVLDELFKALLQKLMTGEIHVSDLDLSALSAANEAEAA